MKLKLQYFGYLMQRADLFEKTPVLGKIEGRRRREQQRMRWSNSIPDSMDTLLLLLLLSLFNHIKLSLTSQTAAHQAPPPLRFSKQEDHSGLPFPSPMHACIHTKSLQSCPTPCNPMDSSPTGSSVHGILQARILEWVAIAFSSMDMSLSILQETVDDRGGWHAAVHGVA